MLQGTLNSSDNALMFTFLYTGLYLSPEGHDLPFCGTLLLPCKSLKYTIERRQYFSLDDTINVIHVKGKVMECESVLVRESLKLVGVNGRPIFNCSQTCNRFLTIFLFETLRKIKEPIVAIKDLEIANKGCNTSLINILKANTLELENIVFKESDRPAILLSEQNGQPMNITVRNSYFLSAYGILAVNFTSLLVTIDKTQFVGNSEKIVTGIRIKNYCRSQTQNNALTLLIKSTSFRHLTGAVVIGASDINFDISIESSSFVGNHLIDNNLPWRKLAFKPGGAFQFAIKPSKVQKQMFLRFRDVIFRNNTYLIGGAVTIVINKIAGKTLRIMFHKCQFISNEAVSGGAIAMTPIDRTYKVTLNGSVVLRECYLEDNKALMSDVQPAQTEKSSNLQRLGGAIYCRNFIVYIVNTIMVNNYALDKGGSLYDRSCFILLNKTTIHIDERMVRLAMNGQAIYSRGVQLLSDVKVEMEKFIPNIKNSRISYVWNTITLPGEHSIPLAIPQRVTLTCLSGNDIDLKVSSIPLHLHKRYRIINEVLFRCFPCPNQFYSLDQGKAYLLNASSRKTHNIKCIPCPYDGDCTSGIKAKANFWGYRSESQGTRIIRFVPCPREYCCQRQDCVTFNSCNKNREGILCGQCRKGYVHGIATSKCIKASECGSLMVWPIIILSGIAYLLFLMYLSEIADSLKMFLARKKSNPSKMLIGYTQTRTTDLKNRLSQSYAISLIKIIFFFCPVEPLIRVNQNASHKNNFISITQSLSSLYKDTLNFKISLSCPLKNVSPIISQVLPGAFPILLLILLGLTGICCSLITHLKKSVWKRNEHRFDKIAAAFTARLIACLVTIVLLSYASTTKTTLALLNCIEINQIRVLYIDGTVICYKTWQYILMAFSAVFILPLPISLAVATRRLKRRDLTVKQFLLLLFFPIWSIISPIGSCALCCVTKKKKNPNERVNREWNSTSQSASELTQPLLESSSDAEESRTFPTVPGESHEEAQPPSKESTAFEESPQLDNSLRARFCESQQSLLESQTRETTQNVYTTSNKDHGPTDEERNLDAILSVIDAPFSRKQGKYEINWESILIARRLILILIYTFVPFPTLRLSLMLFACFTMILHSAYVNPYPSNFVNKFELFSLFILVTLCFINSFVAFSYETNSYLTGYLKYFPDIFYWMEVILVDVIPVTVLLIITLAIIIRLLQLVCRLFWRGIRSLIFKCQEAYIQACG